MIYVLPLMTGNEIQHFLGLNVGCRGGASGSGSLLLLAEGLRLHLFFCAVLKEQYLYKKHIDE